MHGLGFENTEKKEKKGKKTKTIDQQDDKYQNFNLHEKVNETATKQPVAQQNNAFANFGIQQESNIIMLAPKSKSDIHQAVDYLKEGHSVTVDLQAISQEEIARILDFLSGAIYGLNGSIQRMNGDMFLLTPEGHKILKKN